ncbi:dihydrolipoyl dehydrogenase [Candidatus Pacearchaeota archaeon]|nr:dihydrolipoyl dehydrogenase [Candidatus Pacearchaeota archaeon]
MQKEEYDLIILGAGTGGVTIALYAASHNIKTALVDPGDLGGICLNRGCIPTKAMLHASHLHKLTGEMKQFGIEISKIEMNFQKIMKRVNEIVLQGRNSLTFNLKNKNITIIKNKGSFISQNEIKAGDKILKGKKIIICTGAKPKVPSIKGLEKVDYLLSDDILKINSLPKSLIIVGGGYISLEFATFFNDLGTKVYILEALDRLIGSADFEISKELEKYYVEDGVDIKTSVTISEITKQKKGVKVLYTANGKNLFQEAEEILIATGRAANTFSLNLEIAGIEKEKNGYIKVNEFLETTDKNVYAIGDVNGKSLLAHAAKREAMIVIKNALENKKETMNFDLVPWAVFTSPPIAGIGITDVEAKKRNIEAGIMKAEFKRVGKSIIIGETRGLIKIIYNKKNNKLLGCFIIGDKSDELIHEFSALLTAEATIDTMKKIIHIHPTLAEIVELLR